MSLDVRAALRSESRARLVVTVGLALWTASAARAQAPAPADRQLVLAAAGAAKILVRGTGWFSVGQPALVAAGLSAGVDPASLQLFADGVEQSLSVTGNGDSRFTADEAIEFYGVGRDTAWTDVRTYWLVAGSPGARIAVQAPPPAGAPGPVSYSHTEAVVGRSIYVAAVRNGDASNFFGAAVSTTPVTITVTAPHLDPAAAAAPVLSVGLQGVTATAHTVDVALNGLALGTCTLQGAEDATCSYPATGLVAGANSLTLAAHDPTDYTVTEKIAINYSHLYAADGDTLAFTAAGGSRVDVGGFTKADVRVFDITDPSRPLELVTSITGTVGAFDAVVDVPVGASARALYAFTGANVLAPVAVQADAPSNWSTPQDGELLILSHAAFLNALEPLVARRKAEGWRVQLVSLADVYDERGFGDKSADAVRDFIQAARATWRVPPRFVLLVGDATFDPRNFLGLGDFDFAPTRLIDTATMETASDDWFVDADLDGVPEVAIGRWPVRTADQAAAVVAKTLGYAGIADIGRGALFVSDQDGPGLNFTAASAAAAAQVSGRTSVDLFRRADPGATEAALVDKLNAGPFLVNYLGHGSVQVWDGLLDDTAAAGLNNGHPSIYVVMNCLNGFFHDLYTTSLAETLLEAPGGAVAVWASSTLADFDQQPMFNQEFLMGIGLKSLGEAAVAAKGAITDLDARRTWLLFGDPTLLGSPASPAALDAGAADAAPPDAGRPKADAAPPHDAGGPDAGQATMDGGMPVVGGQDAAGGGGGNGAGGRPAETDAGADASHPPAGGDGCDCAMGDGTAGSAGAAAMMLLGVLAAGARRRRGNERPQRRRPRRWPRRVWAALVLALGVAAGARAQAAYGFRMDITLDRTRVGNSGAPTTLTNYPLLLDITSTKLRTLLNGGRVRNANGYDITFVGNDTTTCGGPSSCTFNYEIESYTATTGHVIAWVEIPGLKTVTATSNQVITVKYGDATISSPTQNVNGTWETNFKAIWHMNQLSSPASDSTSTGASASFNGSPTPATTTGLIGSGLNTSGTTGTGYLDYRLATFNWASTDAFTYEGWFKTSDSYGPLFSQRDNGAGGPDIDITIGYDGSTTSAARMSVLVRDDLNGTFAEVNGATALNDANWHHFAVTRTGGTIQVYVDGASIGSSTNAGASTSITTGASGDYQNIGREGYWVQTSYGTVDEQYLAATFDEFRISNTLRTDDWVVTDYNTMKTPSSTYTLGGEVASTCGDGTKIAGEACDDGNIVSGDGCSSTCSIETGYHCVGTTPSVCSTTCGDGVVAGSEQCDDGGTTNGNGCSSTCTVETGYHCSGAPSVCTGAAAEFSYYKTISVDRTKVGTASAPTTLSNYPMLFSVTDSSLRTVANGGRVQNANGDDIIFRGIDATTCGGTTACTFSHEIEKYVASTGQLIAWVNIPVLNTQTNSSNTSFEILFGNTSISTSTERVPFTWDSSFTGVWHLGPDATGTVPQPTDSTSNANDGTSAGATTATGAIGSGVATDGSTSYVSFDSGTSLNVGSGNDFTYSAWVKTTDADGAIFSLRSSTNDNPVLDIMVGMDGASTNPNDLMALMRDDSGSALGDAVDTSTSFNDGNWHLVSVTRSGTTLNVYDNALLVKSATVSSSSISSDLRNLGTEGRWVQDGYTSATNEYLAATFDELRASTTARSLDWITTDYNSQSSPSTFISYTTGTAAEVATDSHTEAAIVSLQATDNCPGTSIAWQTGYEVDALGFNVYREQGGQRVRLNASLLPAKGIAGGGGYSYQFADAVSADPSRTYWVEEVRFSLQSDWYGPVGPVAGPSCGTGTALTSPTYGTSGSPTPVSPTPVIGGSAPAEAGAAGGCTVAGRTPTSWLVFLAAVVFLLVPGLRQPRTIRKWSRFGRK
jgi:MYXO-CTERM domain-containing protein